jgi:hypothetical protein
VGVFNTPLFQLGHQTKNINKETSELNGTKGQMDLTDIYKIFHQTFAAYTSSEADRHFSK